ncbi:MAG TPA: hypothetical protein VIJ86_11815 [Acidimicrobiales bacterium]
MDGSQSSVARAHAIVSLVLKIVQKRPDQRSVEVTKVERAGRCPAALMHESEQQTKRVSIRGHGVCASLTLINEPIGEERL